MFKSTIRAVLLIFLLITAAHSQTVVTPTVLPNGSITSQVTLSSSLVSGPFVNITGSGINLHKFTWNEFGTVSGGAVKLQQCTAADATTCTDLIAAETVTSSGGPTALTSGVVNYVRFTASTPITGSGTVVMRYYGYVDRIANLSGSGTIGECAYFTAATVLSSQACGGGGGGITGSGVTDRLTFWTSTSSVGSNAVFVISQTSGYMGVGTFASSGSGALQQEFQVNSTSTADPRGIGSYQFTTDALGGRFNCAKSRGTPTAMTTVVTADVLCRTEYWGHDGTQFIKSARIAVVSTGTIGTNRMPSTIMFETSTDASPSVLTTALTLGANQTATFAAGILGTTATMSSLTSTRVLIAGTSGLITDDAGMTYDAANDDLTIVGQFTSAGVQFGTGAASTSTLIDSVFSTNANIFAVQAENSSSGAAARSTVRVKNGSSSLTSLSMTVFGTGFTTAGLSIQDYGSLLVGTSLSGLVIGTEGSHPIVFGTNNTSRLTIAGDGTTILPADNVTAFGGTSNRFTSINSVVYNSGASAGASVTLTCGAGQAVKNLTTVGGIVTAASCGAP